MTFIGNLKQIFGGSGRQFGMVFALFFILLLFQWTTDGLTLQPQNLINVVTQYSYILILAVGMVMVIIAGHIDLSVGSIAAFTGIVVAKVMRDADLGWPVGILVGLGVGALIGIWQGFWVAYVGVPAFIVTLAGMLIFRGGNQFIGDSTSVPVSDAFSKIGSGYLPEVGPDTGYNNLTLILGLILCLAIAFREIRSRTTQAGLGAVVPPLWVTIVKIVLLVGVTGYAFLLFASGRPGTGFPISGCILLAMVLFYSFVMNTSIFGRHIYAVGGNSHAAELSGVKSKRINFFVMMNMAILASLAGMIFVALSHASGPQDGNGWELDAISAVFIGGAAVSGGVGTVIGSIVGGLVMAFLSNGLALEGVGSDRVQMIKGAVLLAAVGIDVYNKSRGRASIIGLMMSRFIKNEEVKDASVGHMTKP